MPTDEIEKLTSGLPPVALARIELADRDSVATILAALAQFWRSSVTLTELIQHRPEELYSLFVQYAQSKFDRLAEELLSYSKAEKYRVDLDAVISSISRDICPEPDLLHPNGRARSFSELWDLGNWDSLFSREIREEIPGVCGEGGEWEMYVGRSLDDHWYIPGYQDVKRVVRDAKGPEDRLIFIQLMYQFHLRLSPNYQKFKRHLYALLSQRVDIWEARLNLRIAEGEAAKQLRQPEKGGSPAILEEIREGVPSLSPRVDIRDEELHRPQAEQSGVAKTEIPVPKWTFNLVNRKRYLGEPGISASSNVPKQRDFLEGLSKYAEHVANVGLDFKKANERPEETSGGKGASNQPPRASAQNGRETMAPPNTPGHEAGRKKRRGRRPNGERREAIRSGIAQYGEGWRDHLDEIFTELDRKEVPLGDFAGMKVDLDDGKTASASTWAHLELAEGEQRKQIVDALRKYTD